MRTPVIDTRRLALSLPVALVAALSLAGLALAKEGGIVTLAAPIPRDAEPGSTLTVEFTVMVPGENRMTPVQGSPMVLKLIGPDGATTEAMGHERGTPGTYVAVIKVPASGIASAAFGLRGTGLLPDGTTAIEDIGFDVDGLLFTTTAHPAAPAAATAAGTSSTATAADARPAIVGGLAAIVAVGLGLALVGRRRALRSA
jgi:hypothetical protein